MENSHVLYRHRWLVALPSDQAGNPEAFLSSFPLITQFNLFQPSWCSRSLKQLSVKSRLRLPQRAGAACNGLKQLLPLILCLSPSSLPDCTHSSYQHHHLQAALLSVQNYWFCHCLGQKWTFIRWPSWEDSENFFNGGSFLAWLHMPLTPT